MGYQKLALPLVVIALGAYLPGAGCSTTSCFAAGTPIATPGGPVPIEQLGVGDLVYTYDALHDRVSVHPVTAVHRHDDQRLGRLGEPHRAQPLWVTGNHPVYLPESDEYVPAGDLPEAGTVLRLDDDMEIAPLGGVSFSATSRIDRVYNISVAGPENYFAAGVLVHNKSPIIPSTTTGATSPIATAIAATSSGGSTGTNGSNSNSGSGGATSTDGGVMTTTGGAGEPGSGGAAGEAGGGGAP